MNCRLLCLDRQEEHLQILELLFIVPMCNWSWVLKTACFIMPAVQLAFLLEGNSSAVEPDHRYWKLVTWSESRWHPGSVNSRLMCARSLDGLDLCGSYELGEDCCLSRMMYQGLLVAKMRGRWCPSYCPAVHQQQWCWGKNTGEGVRRSRISNHVTKGKLMSPLWVSFSPSVKERAWN